MSSAETDADINISSEIEMDEIEEEIVDQIPTTENYCEHNNESDNIDENISVPNEIEYIDESDNIDEDVDINGDVDNIDEDIHLLNEEDVDINEDIHLLNEFDRTNQEPSKPKTIEQAPRAKRGLPKTMLANQQKYLEALEKQQRMITSKKEKNKSGKNKSTKNKKSKPEPAKIVSSTIPQPGMRRVIVAGKVKYLPIKVNSDEEIDETGDEPVDEPIRPIRSIISKDIEPVKNTISKPLPSAIQRKMELHKAALTMATSKNKNAPAKKIPSKYAKQMENDVKKQTVKNIKNFSDLRRLKAIQDLSPDINIDTNKASIIELRKLKVEQRKMEQAAQKKRAETNKRETAVQEILKNDKMSKFAKTVAIKNLSVNSRNRKRNQMSNKIEN